MNLGTIQTEDGYAYDVLQNGCILSPLRRTTVAPFGRPVVNEVGAAGLAEYATLAAASAFAAALKAHGASGIAPAEEAATFVTDHDGVGVPKWEIVFPATARRVNAGVIASILGNDPAYGYDVPTKAGEIAKALGETYDPAVHVPLTSALLRAAQAVAK